MDWIYLTQDKYKWRAPANVVMKPLVPYNAEKFLTVCRPVSYPRKNGFSWLVVRLAR
jgi:hypothetical protein